MQDAIPLVGRQDVQIADRPFGLGDDRFQEPDEALHQCLDARPIEQVGRILDHARDPGRSAVRPALLAQAHRQVELRARRRDRLGSCGQARQIKIDRAGVLQRQHHLEQRMARQRARRVEHLHQPLERNILVTVGGEIARPHPTHQLAEARVARRVGAQHQRVDEEPDQVVQRAVGAPGNRAADRDVGARPEPRQQRRKPSLQHHEQARPALAGHTEELAVQLRIQRERNHIAAIARHRRPRTVVGKIELLGQVAKGLRPVTELARNRAGAILLGAEKLMLPQRVVRIVNLQRGKFGRSRRCNRAA